MLHSVIQTPDRPARHARLFELIRQQTHARNIACNAGYHRKDTNAAMAEFARRAAASWRVSS
jgi:hypothetical protein